MDVAGEGIDLLSSERYFVNSSILRREGACRGRGEAEEDIVSASCCDFQSATIVRVTANYTPSVLKILRETNASTEELSTSMEELD